MAEVVFIEAVKKNGMEVAYYGSQGNDGFIYFSDEDFYRFKPVGRWEDNLYVLNRTRRSWTKCKSFTSLSAMNFQEVSSFGQDAVAPGSSGGGSTPAGGQGVEDAVKWAIAVANDESHGYDQASSKRWGPDYDCSSLVYEAFRVGGGFTGLPYHAGNTHSMIRDFRKVGFSILSGTSSASKLYRGDILLKSGHTEIYIGNGRNVGAHINEFRKTTGGRTGDQTKKEICVGNFYGSWSNVIRYTG